jgi:AcrR family transcriptional regulator
MAARPPASRPSLREEQKAVTRRRLLDAALEVLDARGFHAATLEEIAAAAGVNRGTIYLHFKNKAEIVTALAAENEVGSDALYRNMAAARTRADLERVFDRVIGHWSKRLGPLFRHTRDAGLVDPAMAARRRAAFDGYVLVMRDILVGHGVDEASARARAYTLTAMFGAMVERIGDEGLPTGIRRTALRDALIDLFEAARTP